MRLRIDRIQDFTEGLDSAGIGCQGNNQLPAGQLQHRCIVLLPNNQKRAIQILIVETVAGNVVKIAAVKGFVYMGIKLFRSRQGEIRDILF